MAPRNDRVSPTPQTRSPAQSFLQAVDNFYAPARDRRGEASIQEGISAINSVLEERFAEERAADRDDEFQQGVADAIREQAGEELQGVQTGSMFRQHSRFYMAGLNETRGRSAAADFRLNMQNAYNEWEDRDRDDDGTLFREWMNGQLAEFTNGLGENRHILAGALPTAQQVANNLAQHHMAYTERRIAAAARASYRNIHADIWNQVGDGEGQLSVEEALAASLGTADDQYTFEGGEANGEMVGAVIDYANVANDTRPLEALLNGAESGAISIGLGHRADLAEALDRTRIDVEQAERRANAELQAEQEARTEAMLNGYASQLSENPYTPIPGFEEVGDHSTFSQMVRLQDSFQTAATQSQDPLMALGARLTFEGALAGAQSTPERVNVLAEYVSANPTAMSVTQVGQYAQEIIARGSADHVVNNPVVRDASSRFGQTLGAFQTDEYTVEEVSVLRTQGERHFDEYFIMGAETIDVGNPAAILNHIREAESYAMERLAFDFPEIMRERIERSPAEARALDAASALETRDTAVAEAHAQAEAEAVEFFRQFAEDTTTVETASEPTTTPEASESTPSAPVVSQEELFEGQVLQELIDSEAPIRPVQREVREDPDAAERSFQIAIEAYNSDPAVARIVDRIVAQTGLRIEEVLEAIEINTDGQVQVDLP